MRTSPRPARSLTRYQYAERCVRRPPGWPPAITQGLPGTRVIPASTTAAVGVSGTMRAPVLASRNRNSPAVRSTSSHRRVRISLSRHPVSIKRRSAVAACAGIRPSASRARSTRPTRRYSCSVRNRSRLRRLYLTTERQGLPPSRDRPQASPRENIWERISSTRFAARGVSRSR